MSFTILESGVSATPLLGTIALSLYSASLGALWFILSSSSSNSSFVKS
jgi:hypothetical protein